MRKHIVPFVFYLLLSLIAMYNPIFHMATHVPGDATQATDYYHFHWNFWWIRHALATGQNIYLTDYVFAPFTSNLAYHTLTPFWYPVWAVIEPLAGTVAAMTVILALDFTLTGWAFYLLLRREGVKTLLALAFGAILQFSPLIINSLYWTNINLMSVFWLPTLILLWREVVRRGWIWALIFGVALYGVIMTDVQWLLLAAPIVIGRDHLDSGSVASPNRETEAMQDGSDAVSDWPLLNALLNTASGATWVSLHHGGGVGMGYSQHSGVVIVADGTDAAAARLRRVLWNDPATGVMRHADAGYEIAIQCAKDRGLDLPMVG